MAGKHMGLTVVRRLGMTLIAGALITAAACGRGETSRNINVENSGKGVTVTVPNYPPISSATPAPSRTPTSTATPAR